MKLEITKEWFGRRAALEGDHEIGAGRPVPPRDAADGQDEDATQGQPADVTAPPEAKDE
ncbi:hypothetical protein [Rhizobium sp. BK176]|uniref:hypothetical protein n=1 Tax=Rhizobium sp. BK176 TaxID=2587071 RepID=UPI002168497B|nr:hypothetical protein [Rhizobium sp. BK176]MCS4089371.1 hypothetical protein [Rhizobium sp. BK176]